MTDEEFRAYKQRLLAREAAEAQVVRFEYIPDWGVRAYQGDKEVGRLLLKGYGRPDPIGGVPVRKVWNVTLDRSLHGQGYGTQMYEVLADSLRQQFPDGVILAPSHLPPGPTGSVPPKPAAARVWNSLAKRHPTLEIESPNDPSQSKMLYLGPEQNRPSQSLVNQAVKPYYGASPKPPPRPPGAAMAKESSYRAILEDLYSGRAGPLKYKDEEGLVDLLEELEFKHGSLTHTERLDIMKRRLPDLVTHERAIRDVLLAAPEDLQSAQRHLDTVRHLGELPAKDAREVLRVSGYDPNAVAEAARKATATPEDIARATSRMPTPRWGEMAMPEPPEAKDWPAGILDRPLSGRMSEAARAVERPQVALATKIDEMLASEMPPRGAGSRAGLLTPPRYDTQTGKITPYGESLEKSQFTTGGRGGTPERLMTPDELAKMDEKLATTAASRVGQLPDYPFYVTDQSGRILSGWEHAEDAQDALREIQDESPGSRARIQSSGSLKNQLRRSPDPSDWMDVDELTAHVRRGQPLPKPPPTSILAQPEGQRVLLDMSEDKAREMHQRLSEEWTDRRGRPRPPREIAAAEARVLEEAARYGTWEPDLVDPFDPQPPRQTVKALPGVPEGTLADPRPPLGSETWERHSGGSPKEEFARKATREGFEEAAELGGKLTTKGASKALLKFLGPLGFVADVMYPSPLEAAGLYGSEFEGAAEARVREEARAGSAEFLAEQPGYSERPPWADPEYYKRQRFGDDLLQEQMPSTRMIREGELK